MKLSAFFLITTLTAQLACDAAKQQASTCPLNPGSYPVQSALYQGDKGHYELMILNAPACFQQPLKIKSLQLARQEEKDSQEKVKLQYNGEENATLYMAEDFQIKMVQTVTENGVSKEQSGSWSPFMTGVAGAAVGAIAGSMLTKAFSKPQYYTPPPMEAGKSQVFGYGGAGSTREGAVRNYQQNYASRSVPNPSVQNSAPMNNGTDQKKSFFKTKNQNTYSQPQQAQPGAVRSYQPASSSSSKRGFFKSRRR